MPSSSLIAQRLRAIPPSPTLSIGARAKAMKAAGEDVINLAVGEPDFPTPPHICDAAKAALDNGETRYTAVGGTSALKAAIQAKFKRENGLDYQPEQIIASTGGKQVLFNALMASLNAGDEVIIPAPYWVSYPEMVRLADGIPVIAETHEKDGFVLSPDALERAITPKTKWLVLNSPSNPTGGIYDAVAYRALAEVLRAAPHVYIICDDIYEHLIYNGEFVTLANIAPDIKDRILIINGVSKAYSMTGWRLGYGAGPAELIKAMTTLQGQSTSNPCSITQAAAVAALNGDQSFLTAWRSAFKARRDKTAAALNAIPGLSVRVPSGAFYLYVNCSDLIGDTLADDTAVCSYLLENAKIAAVPGSAFGLSPYFRISYAVGQDGLDEACARIKVACEKLA